MSAFGLIEAERASFSVPLMCRVLGVSRSGYYDWKGRSPSRRSREDAALTERIRELYEHSREIYGYARAQAEFRARGIHCGRKRVARLMRKRSLEAARVAGGSVPLVDWDGRAFPVRIS